MSEDRFRAALRAAGWDGLIAGSWTVDDLRAFGEHYAGGAAMAAYAHGWACGYDTADCHETGVTWHDDWLDYCKTLPPPPEGE